MTQSPKLSPMFVQYHEIKEQHPDCLLFFRMGDFYELFYEDAKIAAEALDITLTKRGREVGEDIPMCGVPAINSDIHVERLIRKGFKVAVCEQMETPEEARQRRGKPLVHREVIRILTPGTVTEENLLPARSHNFLLSLVESKDQVGCAWIDISTGDFFTQDLMLGDVASQLERLAPKEILMPSAFLKTPELFEVFEEWKRALTPLPPARFDHDNGLGRLLGAFGVHSLEAFGIFTPLEIQAAGGILDYVNLTQKGVLPRLAPLRKITVEGFLEIDAATRRNLELTRTLQGTYAGSLLHTIDRTLTGPGGRRLYTWMAMPLTTVQGINERLDLVDFFVRHSDLRATVRGHLKHCPDGERLISRLTLQRGGPRDLGALRQGLEVYHKIHTLLAKETLPTLLRLSDLTETQPLSQRLGEALKDDGLPSLPREGGFIRQGFSGELDEVRTLRGESKNVMALLENRYVSQTGIPSLKIKYNNILGYHIEITKTHLSKVPDYFTHRQTMVNGSRFTTVELAELEQKILQAEDKALSLELAIYQELVQGILGKADALVTQFQLLSLIDCAAALSEFSQETNCVRPVLVESLDFTITEGRHPVVAACLKTAGTEFAGNDCTLSPAQAWLLTGPNMAGKSTFLRQNALIALLAHMGSFVPAKTATIGLVDRIFSRVGASDNLARGQSTFMVEMIETAMILNQATQRSLVILDEIGRGTATYDGLAIASATLAHLHDTIQCRTLFATHYHELTQIHKNLKHLAFYTMSVREWEDRIVFLHKVIPGCADKSYGIHVAKLAGLPSTVIAQAERMLITLEKQDPSARPQALTEDLPLFRAPQKMKPLPSLVEESLRTLDLNHLTPLEALNQLYALKEKLAKEQAA